MLSEKTLTELRTIAQGLGISDIFSKSPVQLMQDIEQKNRQLIPQPKIDIPLPVYDARLMTAIPGEMCDIDTLKEMLKPFTDRGLKVSFTNEMWRYSIGKKEDTGTLRMPLRTALKKAQEILS